MKGNDSARGLRDPGLLAQRPTIGWSMTAIGALIFSFFAFNVVTNGPLVAIDTSIAHFFQGVALHSPAWIIAIMVAGYYIGLQGIVVVELVIGAYFLSQRLWKELVMAVVILAPGGLFFEILTHAFKRPRPFTLFDKPIWAGSPNIPGFPSGHALHIILVCFFISYFWLPLLEHYWQKVLVVTGAVVIILFIGGSRVYVGDHYLTDILAGYAFAVAWFGLACTSLELYFARKEKLIRYGRAYREPIV